MVFSKPPKRFFSTVVLGRGGVKGFPICELVRPAAAARPAPSASDLGRVHYLLIPCGWNEDTKELLGNLSHLLLGTESKLSDAGEHTHDPEKAMLDVLRAATLLAAVLAGVWLYNSVQTGSVLQLTAFAETARLGM
jgi:hypothetical protein